MEKVFYSILVILSVITCAAVEESCSKAYGCVEDSSSSEKYLKYILYNVNIGEGFNLKRDVYMRMAMFVRALTTKSKDDWHLVLPPWTKQWHWKKEERDISLKWHNFFDVFSLQLYSPVIEIDQFYAQNGKSVDEVYILQHFPEFYEWKGDGSIDWSERWSLSECRESPHWREENGSFIFFRGKHFVKAEKVQCVSFQGTSAYLESIISSTEVKSIMFDRAEIATHITYGDSDYWSCRRSMRFAKHLVRAAKEFRIAHLNSSDEQDRTLRPEDWRAEKPQRSAQGGPYLGVHLRRQDFVLGRPKEVPSLDQSIQQIKTHLTKANLTTVFIATDMDADEYEYVKMALLRSNIIVVRYINENTDQYKDGELAIIDQIICSHARVFVGTHESTFSYRIQEEREIMGFPAHSTFNRFCPSFEINDCSPPTKWLIKFPDVSSDEHKFRNIRNDGEL